MVIFRAERFASIKILITFAKTKFMAGKLIGRDRECRELKRCVDSEESEFTIVCGRRRIGKTFLVEQFFDGNFDFKYVGGHNLRTREQLTNFSKALYKFSGHKPISLSDWFDAFGALQSYLEELPQERKKIIFIDEMPWIDTRRSNFVSALEAFWNGWAMSRNDIVLVATGSATSWMTDKLLKNRGGLYNRIRHRIYLKPFSLKETEEFLIENSFDWDRYQILQSYMLTGGVPFYLKMLDPQLSLAQNIDELCFCETGQFRYEFDELYHAIFPGAESYVIIVKTLAENRNGLTRTQISNKSKISGAYLSRVLLNLERCNFIEKTHLFGNRKTDAIYRLVDYFTLFYFKFISADISKDPQWWTHHMDSRSVLSWMGLTFELICMSHHQQIKQALGISGMATNVSTWRSLPDKETGTPGAQIDLIIERADRIIHLCELKFSQEPYNISIDYADKIRQRGWLFKEHTHTRKSIVNTFVTTYGLKKGKHNSIVHSETTMDDLFKF